MGEPTAHNKRPLLVRVAPIIFAVLILGSIFMEHPPERIAAEVLSGDAWLLGPIAILSAIVGLLVVGLADTWVVRYGVGPVEYATITRGKAGSSMLDVVGYAASHGGYAYWLAKAVKVPGKAAVGALLYIMTSDLAAVCLVASLPMVFLGVDVPSTVRWITPVLASAAVFMLVMPSNWRGRNSKALWRQPFWQISRSRAAAQLAMRALQILVWTGATWWAASAFGLRISLANMCIIAPVVLLTTALPMNVAGFGVAQGAWLLFTDLETPERLLAFGFVWNLALALAVVLRGLPFIEQVMSEIAPAEVNEQPKTNEANGPEALAHH